MIADVTAEEERLSALLSRYDLHWLPEVRGLSADAVDRPGLIRISTGDAAERLSRMVTAYRQERDGLLRFARSRLGRHADAAEDVVHEVLRKICQNPPQMREPGSESNYLFTAVRQEASKTGQRIDDERRRHDDDPEIVAQRADGEASFEDRTLFHLVLSRALVGLSPQERAVVELVDVGTLTVKQAADRLGIALGTAKKHRFVALRRLRNDPGVAELIA